MCVCSVAQSCLTLCNPMDCSPPGSSVHGILQARIVEWVAISYSRGSSQPRERTCISCLAGGFFTIEPAQKPHLEAHYPRYSLKTILSISEPVSAVTLWKLPCEWLPGNMTSQHLTKSITGVSFPTSPAWCPYPSFPGGSALGNDITTQQEAHSDPGGYPWPRCLPSPMHLTHLQTLLLLPPILSLSYLNFSHFHSHPQ